MSSLAILGTQSVVGANLAAVLSRSHVVSGLSGTHPSGVTPAGNHSCSRSCETAIRDWIASQQIEHIVFCGTQACSAWDTPDREQLKQDAAAARLWARCAHDAGAAFTLISSDAILTGPWMFHAEDSQCLAAGSAARCLAGLEKDVLAAHPQALVVRTHAYGWSPNGDGWLERCVEDLQQGARPFDCQRHASPILVTEFARLLEDAWQADARGILHIAGAERTNPYQFARRLSEILELPAPHAPATQSLTHGGSAFGEGETSLRTRRFRQLTGLAAPMLNEGLNELAAQQHDGYREGLCERRTLAKVA